MNAEDDQDSTDYTLTSSSSDGDSTSTGDENDPYICSLCKRISIGVTRNTDPDLRGILEFIETQSPYVTKAQYSCQTCLYKLYTVLDQQRLLAARGGFDPNLPALVALVESTGASEPPAPMAADSNAPSTSAAAIIRAEEELNNNSNENRESSPPTYHDDNSSEQSHERYESPYKEGTDQIEEEEDINNEPDEISEEIENQTEQDQNEGEVQEHDDNNEEEEGHPEQFDLNESANIQSDPASSPSHLDVMYERSESALATESGGNLDQYKTPPLQCRYCPKVFVLKKPFQKHMRSHQGKLLSARSASSNRGRTTPTNVVYVCTDCSATFDSSLKLKNHCRIHLKRYYCSYCHKESLSLYGHDFHEAECRGEQMAKEELREPRRMTRSIARSTRSVNNVEATSSVTAARSNKTAKSNKTSKSSAAKTKTDDDDDDEDDGATSVAYSNYTALNSYVENWVAGTCRSEYRRQFSNVDPNLMVVSEKEYDTIMLENLIKQVDHNLYICSYIDCIQKLNTLREMCLHQIVDHKFKTWYNCRKCRGKFTTKVFLDYHLYMQNYGEYRCNKCSMCYNYEYQLQYHLHQHQNKTESFPCLYCDNNYMSSRDLRIHCLETGHDPKKRKKIISIDHSMTIKNDIPPEQPPAKKTYKCTINIMDLPKMPTKRPKHIDWPFVSGKIFLGELDFENKPGRNCVQAK